MDIDEFNRIKQMDRESTIFNGGSEIGDLHKIHGYLCSNRCKCNSIAYVDYEILTNPKDPVRRAPNRVKIHCSCGLETIWHTAALKALDELKLIQKTNNGD